MRAIAANCDEHNDRSSASSLAPRLSEPRRRLHHVAQLVDDLGTLVRRFGRVLEGVERAVLLPGVVATLHEPPSQGSQGLGHMMV
jgi:hypothetical protein